jgi:predicted AlkP superfamily phosphohydrolase/phosphomutase
MDPVLGQVREAMGDEPYTLMVMSDHGFAPFRRKFSLNTWLVEEGYLVLAEGRERETSLKPPRAGEVLFWMPGVVDWSRTRAYGMGFNGLYLNMAGREGGQGGVAGIVQPGPEAEALIAEIAAKLEAIVDPLTGEHVVLRAYPARTAYQNHERLSEAPDLIVGYASGYCNSDESSLGRITMEVLTDNLGGTFNGSHLMAPEVVPGTLLANRPVRTGPRGLTDLTAEILIRYGLDVPAEVQGGRVLADDPPATGAPR